VRVGAQALAGVRFFLMPHVALFGEYRFVHTADFTFTPISSPGTSGGLPTLELNRLQFALTSHMLQVGIAYHW
jgi:opacity protein-like surface antigen